MISVEYTSQISNSAITCDLVNEENGSYWQYRENGKKVSCSTSENQRTALEWFANVYKEMKPVFTLK